MNDLQNLELDPQLKNDCFLLGYFGSSQLLLLNNALVPWFIVVPNTRVTEFYELPHDQQIDLLNVINILSSHIKQTFSADKLNIASIGNIVSQMHIHIIGRHINDFCWPDVVWGTKEKKPYQKEAVEAIKLELSNKLSATFKAV